ncbi:rhodopsin-like [Acanthaster planci]|uniref:Rhodopsin-like n=1 Tax=Acanthaster planci TaxID=133434 RepID=A0A8B7Z0U2_ACAPL|nr:rhodopsin-like [Acanthaster planci]
MILVLPLSVIVFSYTKILVTVKKMAKCQVSNRQSRRAEKKVTIMVVVMIVAFMVAWSPYAILALYSAFGNSAYVTPLVATLPAMFAKSSTAYNPVIYFLLHDKLRVAPQCRPGTRTAVSVVIGDGKGPCAGQTATGKARAGPQRLQA